MRWAERSRETFGYRRVGLFGIQKELSQNNEKKVLTLKSIGFDGYAVGGQQWERDKKRYLKF